MLIGQDENGVSYGLQTSYQESDKSFETNFFKEQHNDLYYKYCTEIKYNEYKAIGGADAE